LAGNALPSVWTPPPALRDDRELVRARTESAEAGTAVKLQILSLLKRYGRELPAVFRKNHNWTKKFSRWVAAEAEQLPAPVQPVLACLVRRQQVAQEQIDILEQELKELSKTPRYRAPCEALRKLTGVGLMTAMTFLTEMGDLARFDNRRQVGAYLGLCPASFESGEVSDRKGHITRQGPSRLRKMLCQAAWTAIRRDEATHAAHHRISRGKKQLRKKAAVAIMRKLGIRMWHVALAAGISPDFVAPPIPPPTWCAAPPIATAQAG
jgi:transposase